MLGVSRDAGAYLSHRLLGGSSVFGLFSDRISILGVQWFRKSIRRSVAALTFMMRHNFQETLDPVLRYDQDEGLPRCDRIWV